MSSVRPSSSDPNAWAAAPARELARLSWPITVSTLSYGAMTLVDTLLVAQVGADELAGVGLAGTVLFALLCFGIGTLRGVKTVVAQALGARRGHAVPDYLGAGVVLALGMGVLAVALAWLIAPAVARLCASPRAGEFAAEYLQLRALGAPMLLLYCALREARYGEGDSTTPMRASLAGNAVNIGLSALFVLGLGLGVPGVAIGTLLGEAVQLAVLAVPMAGALRRLRWRAAAARVVWKQGAPNGVQFLMEVGAFFLLTATMARMSSTDAAAHHLVLQIVNVSFLPAHAIAEAASVLVGNAVGAGRFDLVRRVAWHGLALGLGYAAVCFVVLVGFGDAIIGAMAGGDPVLAATALTLVHIGVVFLLADAANVIARGVLRGAGDVRFAAFVGVLFAWAFLPPLAWLLGVEAGLGAAGGWIGLAVEIILGAAVFWVRVARGSWRAAAESSRAAVVAASGDPLSETGVAEKNTAEDVSPSRNRLETATPEPVR